MIYFLNLLNFHQFILFNVMIWAPLSVFRSRFFAIANHGRSFKEILYHRNDKKSSTQAGARFAKLTLFPSY